MKSKISAFFLLWVFLAPILHAVVPHTHHHHSHDEEMHLIYEDHKHYNHDFSGEAKICFDHQDGHCNYPHIHELLTVTKQKLSKVTIEYSHAYHLLAQKIEWSSIQGVPKQSLDYRVPIHIPPHLSTTSLRGPPFFI